MSKARLVLTALVLDQQSPAEVAARYAVHRAWVYKLKARYQAEGEAAFEPPLEAPEDLPSGPARAGGRPDRADPHGADRRRAGRRDGHDRLAPGPPPRTPGGPVHHQPPPHQARPKAVPTADRSRNTHDRVRTDRIDDSGCITLRVAGRLHHIGIGRTHARTHVLLLVQDLHVRVVNAATGELLRDLLIDPDRDYQPTAAPRGPTRRTPNDNSRTHGSWVRLSPMS